MTARTRISRTAVWVWLSIAAVMAAGAVISGIVLAIMLVHGVPADPGA